MTLIYCKFCDCSMEMFNFNDGQLKLTNPKCKVCISKYNKEYRANHREKLIIHSKEYSENHKDNIKINQRNWYLKRREEILTRAKNYRETHKEQRNANEKKRKETDITYMLRTNMSKAICIGLRIRNSKKSNSILKVLPYSMGELRVHLENQFEPWMNWENWGRYDPKTWNEDDPMTWTWQIDHYSPHSEFKYSSMTD